MDEETKAWLEKLARECVDLAAQGLESENADFFSNLAFYVDELKDGEHLPDVPVALRPREDQIDVVLDEDYVNKALARSNEDLLAFWLFWALRRHYQVQAIRKTVRSDAKMSLEEDQEMWGRTFVWDPSEWTGNGVTIRGYDLDACAFALTLGKIRNPDLEPTDWKIPFATMPLLKHMAAKYIRTRPETHRVLARHPEKSEELGITL